MGENDDTKLECRNVATTEMDARLGRDKVEDNIICKSKVTRVRRCNKEDIKIRIALGRELSSRIGEKYKIRTWKLESPVVKWGIPQVGAPELKCYVIGNCWELNGLAR